MSSNVVARSSRSSKSWALSAAPAISAAAKVIAASKASVSRRLGVPMRAAMSVPMPLVFLDGHHLIFVRRIDLDLEEFGGQVFFVFAGVLVGGGFVACVFVVVVCGELVW